MHRRFVMFSCMLLAGIVAGRALGDAKSGAATTKADEVNLIAMGDWGSGAPQQRTVAHTLADYVAAQPVKFDGTILVGDNFYVPLKSINDSAWQNLFEEMYDPAKLSMPFYVALGNHDCPQGKFKVELDYAKAHPESRWKFPSRWYRLELPQDKPLVTIFMLDSDKDYLTASQWTEESKWLADELAKPPTTPWVTAAAHHPLFSNGSHGDTGPLQTQWGPLFKKYNVDFYICGHDHDLQHIQPNGWFTSFILCGGGGKTPRPMRMTNRGPFSRSLDGFVHLELTPEKAIVKYIDSDGKLVHEFERTKAGAVKVITTTGHDAPTKHQLKAINGIGAD